MFLKLDGVSIVIPCYNEENAIQKVLDEIDKTMQGTDIPYEIIVVNDASTDASASLIDPLRFQLIEHKINCGYGATLKTGVRSAKYNCICITDADGTYPNHRIPDFFELLEDCEMVVGSRTGALVNVPLIRRPAKWILTKLASFLSGYSIPDINSGFRTIRKELWEKYETYFPEGFSLTTTITLTSLVNKHRVHYEPINYHHRIGKSKIRPIYDTLNFVKLIVRTVLYFDPLKVFIPLSLFLFFAAVFLGFGTFSLEYFYGIGKFMDVSTITLFLCSVQVFAIGALAELINVRLK